jgi:hypothetical protein
MITHCILVPFEKPANLRFDCIRDLIEHLPRFLRNKHFRAAAMRPLLLEASLKLEMEVIVLYVLFSTLARTAGAKVRSACRPAPLRWHA